MTPHTLRTRLIRSISRLIGWFFGSLGCARRLRSAASLRSHRLRSRLHDCPHLPCQALEARSSLGLRNTDLQSVELPHRRRRRAIRHLYRSTRVATIWRSAAGLLGHRLHCGPPLHRPLARYTEPTISAHHRRHVRRVAALDDRSFHLGMAEEYLTKPC